MDEGYRGQDKANPSSADYGRIQASPLALPARDDRDMGGPKGDGGG